MVNSPYGICAVSLGLLPPFRTVSLIYRLLSVTAIIRSVTQFNKTGFCGFWQVCMKHHWQKMLALKRKHLMAVVYSSNPDVRLFTGRGVKSDSACPSIAL